MPKSYEFKAPKVEHNRNLTGALPSGFDPDMLPDPREGFMLGLVARRGSGKSFCIYNLLSNFYKGCFDKVYIFNPSYGNDMTLSPESLDLPEESFYDKVDVDFIEGVIESQIAQKKQYDLGKLKKKHLDRILLVFDDCISDPNFVSNRNANIMNKIAFKRKSIIEEQGGICDEKKFEEMFDYATKEPHDFFYIYGSCPNKEAKFRRNIDNIIEYKN